MRTVKVASVIAALLLAGAAPADARTRPVESFIRHVEVSTDDGRVETFEGVVEAKTDRCVDNRKIEVYADPNGKSRLFGEATTDDDGSFEVLGDDATGLDYAIAVFPARRARLRCLGKGVLIRVDRS